MDVQRHSVHTLVFRSLKRTHDTFLLNQGSLPPENPMLQQTKKIVKAKDCYGPILERVKQNTIKAQQDNDTADPPPPGDETFGINPTSAIVPYTTTKGSASVVPISAGSNMGSSGALTMPQKKTPSMAKPKWHAPWKLYRVISGHLVFTDMGFSQWQVEGYSNRPHKQRSWPGVLAENALSVFLRRRSTNQMLGP